MSERDFEAAGEDTIYDGKVMRVVRGRFRYPDGAVAQREIVRTHGSVGIVAHDDEAVVLVRQPREAIGDPNVLEIPAGRLDREGEPPWVCAERELAEEVGLRPACLELLRTFQPSAGCLDEEVHLFLATDLSERHADAGEQERIEVVRWPLHDLDTAIATTQDAKTIIGLSMLRDRRR